MYQNIFSDESNEDDFVAWLSRVMQENSPFVKFEGYDIDFVPQATVKLLYEVLHVRETHNMEFQDFFSLMQQAGEESDLMSLEDLKQDNFVALPVVQEFSKNFVIGFSRLMREIGFKHD
jgi:hypothetical protein